MNCLIMLNVIWRRMKCLWAWITIYTFKFWYFFIMSFFTVICIVYPSSYWYFTFFTFIILEWVGGHIFIISTFFMFMQMHSKTSFVKKDGRAFWTEVFLFVSKFWWEFIMVFSTGKKNRLMHNLTTRCQTASTILSRLHFRPCRYPWKEAPLRLEKTEIQLTFRWTPSSGGILN